MATAAQISVSEYLETTYRPDCDYVDGEVRERNVGKWEHARIQWLLSNWFGRFELEWNIIGGTEQRIQVAPDRVRVADLAVLRPGRPPAVLIEPPLLVIEILSASDTYSDLQERCQDYRAIGVETIWIIDPRTRTGRMCLGVEWIEALRLEVPGTPIHVNLAELFSRLDAI
jgi:Uma2 family endonuclease